jgi:phospholipid/cholesterol/gamma-HCH transport system substrate-binding protein
VGGLEVGSPVKYLGIKVGTIQEITIDPEDVNKVIVELALKQGTPIKTDAVADITSVGITGLKTIEIRGGSNEAVSLEPDSYINPGTSITEEITGKAEIIAEKVENVINNLQTFTEPEKLDKFITLAENISRLADNVSVTVSRVDSIIVMNREDIRESITSAKEITDRLNESSRSIQETVDKVNLLVKSDTVGDILANFREVSLKLKEAEVATMIENIAQAANRTHDILVKIDGDLDRSSQDFTESLQLLKITLENLADASRKINDDPSILIRGTSQKDLPDQDLKK